MKRTITFLMLLLMAGAAMAQGEFVCGDTVRDGNGNAYATVQIGALCWTTSNMRAVSYADGTPIAKAMIYNSERYNDTVANLANFGRLYTWWSAVNVPEGGDTKPAKDTAGFVQGVCPEGWHIPTVGEMNDLRSVPEEDLHSTDFWVLPNANTNSTGFSEVPGGKFSAELDRFEGLYTNSYMWTDSATSSEWVVACNSRYFCNKASEESVRKGDGLSVRCVRVAEVCSEVATFNVDECDVTDTSVLVKGNAKVEKGTFTEYGFVWGISEDALTTTVYGSGVSAMTSEGNFEATIKGLPACGDTVWYAAYAKTSQCKELIYGDTMMFVVCGKAKDAQPCPFAPKIFDNEGNEYNTVQIGNQCWMKENMRCKTSPKGYLTKGDTASYFAAHYYDDESSTIPLSERGMFYNFAGAIDTVFSDTTQTHVQLTFKNRRGICPEGWHIPSEAEWKVLLYYVRGESHYICVGDTSYYTGIAKSLSSESYWLPNQGLQRCTPSFLPMDNNSTGFSAVAAGLIHTGSGSNGRAGIHAHFRSSTQTSDGGTIIHYLMGGWSEVNDFHGTQTAGYSVRCLKDACESTTATIPTVTTLPVKCSNGNGATGGIVTDDGGAQVVIRGVCWSTNPNPTTADNHTSDSIGLGTFNSVITNLTPNTVYYVRAYATNVEGTAYGNEETYIRIADGTPCPCASTVKDHQNNEYNTVWIGCQCWTKENMRCTTSPNGHLTFGGDNTSYTNAYYYDYATSTIPLKDRGLLYNWAGAMDTTSTAEIEASFTNRRGICPEGWHVPSGDEWYEMLYYVGSQRDYICGTDNGSPAVNMIAKALSSKIYWNSADGECVPGHDSTSNNKTGFSIVPAGYCHGSTYYKTNDYAALWSSRSNSGRHAQDRIIMMDFEYVGTFTQDYNNKYAGRSVRCIKDTCGNTLPTTDNCPTVTTTAATNVSSDSAKINGVVTNVSGTVENYGFVWGTNKNTVSTTMNGTSVTAMTADGDFSSILKGLNPCDTIWYAAFAKTSDCSETVYGDTLMFKVPAVAPDYTTCGTVIDIDDNRYTTVKIGAQCWMAENLRVTKYADGTPLIDKTSNSTNNIGFTEKVYFAPNGDANNVDKYGLLYSWAAATNATNTTTSGTFQTWENYEGQGICPDGWHLPSDAEWDTLTNYVRNNYTTCLCDNTSIGKALASATDWKSGGEPADADFFTRLAYTANWGECSIGWPSTTDLNNITGFNAYPAGNWNYEASTDGFFKFGEEAMFWTSTLYGTTHNTYGYNNALKRTMYYYRKDVESNNYYQLNTARSVRCLKDNDCAPVGDAKPCPGTPTVKDHQGNEYNTVQIGNQCWTKENMRCTTSPKGLLKVWSQGNYSSPDRYYTPYCFELDSISYMDYTRLRDIPKKEYGLLYNWPAAMDTTFTAETEMNDVSFTNRRGICPEGWHVPNKDEFEELISYVNSVECYRCKGGDLNIAKAMAAQDYWRASDNECAPGNNQATNNSTGFSAILAAYTPGGYNIGQALSALFWTSTTSVNDPFSNGVQGALAFWVHSHREYLLNGRQSKKTGISVRCLKDADTTCAPVGDAKPCPGTPTVKDHENNVYNTVQIGDQCWTRENMRATTSPTGKTQFQAGTSNESRLTPTYYNNSASAVDITERGLLYNWAAALDTVFTATTDASFTNRRGICPEGWHVPSRAEWQTLIDYEATVECYTCGGDANATAKALAFNNYWASSNGECHVGNDLSANNRTGFSVIPTGYGSLPITNDTTTARFWSSTGNNTTTSFGMMVNYNMANGSVNTGYDQKQGFAVRCVKDADADTTCAPVGDAKPCPGTPTVKDHQGNEYNTVQIGNQCWTKENMRCTTSPKGLLKVWSQGNYSSPDRYYTPYCYELDSISDMGYTWLRDIPKKEYGLLYNWPAAMDTTFTAETEMNDVSFTNRRGICPEGWHVPNKDEFEELISYVNSVECYRCKGGDLNIAKAMAAQDYWRASDNECAPGNNQVTNNSTGFSAILAAYTPGGWNIGQALSALFWTSTTSVNDPFSNGVQGALAFWVHSYREYLLDGRQSKNTGISVRCVKDADADTTCAPVGDAKPCPGTPTVKDHENNVYNTVQIGDQCWTRENMRATTSPTGKTQFQAGTSNESRLTPIYYNNSASAVDITERGLLYNWAAALDTVFTATTDASFTNRRGICPEGWHVPSRAEWQTLIDYEATVECYTCGGNANATAKALAFNNYWASSNGECHVGDDLSANNRTGFSVIPTGYGSLPITNDTTTARFWSSTRNNTTTSFGMMVNYNMTNGSVNTGYDQKQGFAVRCVKDEQSTAENCPTVTTTAATEVAADSSKLNGIVTDITGTVEDYGFVWGTDKNTISTTVNGTAVTAMTSDGAFAAVLKGLSSCDTVWFAAFAKTSECSETVYGDTLMFKAGGRAKDAQPCAIAPTVTDHEGNVYNTVQIGNQCWMKENMRCKTSPKDYLQAGSDTSSFQAYYYDDPTSIIPLEERGYYYNWAGALDTTFTAISSISFDNRRGICPEGWHVPSTLEWDIMELYVNNQGVYYCDEDNKRYLAKAFTTEKYWDSYNGGPNSLGDMLCSPGRFPEDNNNATGFTAIPVGMYGLSGTSYTVGRYTGFWTSSRGSVDGTAGNISIFYQYATLNYFLSASKRHGYSVRCIKDACEFPEYVCPEVITTEAADTLLDKIALKGYYLFNQGTILNSGFVWGYDKSDLVNTVRNDRYNKRDVLSVIDAGVCDTIWYAAFAYGSSCNDTIYGDTLSYVRKVQSCPGISTVTDHEGNVYNTVQIGDQCWTRENMRCTTSPNDYLTAGGSINSHMQPYYFDYTTSGIPLEDRGLLYNWPAAMDTVFASDEDVSFTNRRGICPEGWHVPSDDEWKSLVDYVKSQRCYVCGGDSNAIAKSLASQEYWDDSQETCSPGYEVSKNNATGFSAIPNMEPNSVLGYKPSDYWSSNTGAGGGNAIHFCLGNRYTSFWRVANSKSVYLSVRCLKNADNITDKCPTVVTGGAMKTGTGDVQLTGSISKITGAVDSSGFVYGSSKSAITNSIVNTAMTAATIEATVNGWPVNDTLWFIAFAKTSRCYEIVYGDTLFYVAQSHQSCPGSPTVTDHEGNVYNTVQIGNQCWTKENMRCTTSPTGKTDFVVGGNSDLSRLSPYYYDYNKSVIPLEQRGYLYNWAAAMDTVFASDENVSFTNRRGICPEGWHVPDDSDWTTLTEYVSAQHCCMCSNNRKDLAKVLASNYYWQKTNSLQTSVSLCVPGNDLNQNNTTGFSVVPAGNWLGAFNNITYQSFFWSSSSRSDISAGHYSLKYNEPGQILYDLDKHFGFSVRCLKDN